MSQVSRYILFVMCVCVCVCLHVKPLLETVPFLLAYDTTHLRCVKLLNKKKKCENYLIRPNFRLIR